MADAPKLTHEEEQAKYLEEAQRAVRQHAAFMNASVKQDNLQDVLKHAAAMLGELRTSLLAPQNYYELYIKVFDEMLTLERFFSDHVRESGHRVEDLYEIVQHAGNIIPRLYLLITVGVVWIKSKEVPASHILRDLVEMCKGVQHPTRGLFLRHFLSTMTKNCLPDDGNCYEGEESGTVHDSIDYVLQNFKEMVWLWVRMEQKQIVADPEQRASQRKALRLLVGYNVTRLGSLDGIDLNLYVETVMPRVIEIIANSQDVIAQQYLMEVMIQVFPDEFHLAKLDGLLDAICEQLLPSVNLQEILSSLMDRLGNHAVAVQESQEKRKWEGKAIKAMGEMFRQAILKTCAERPKAMTPSSFTKVQLSLLTLVLKAYPGKLEMVNAVFGHTADILEKQVEDGVALDNQAVKIIRQMLIKPVEHFGNMVSVLDLDDWPRVLGLLSFQPKREVARGLVTAAIKGGEPLASVEHVEKMFAFIAPLVIDGTEGSVDPQDPDFKEDMDLVAKLTHLFRAPDDQYQVQFKILSAVRKQFGQGGEDRCGYTLAPLTMAFLKLALRVKRAIDQEIDIGKVKLPKIFEYVGSILEVLSRPHPKQALHLYLQAARSADKCELGEKCDELLRAGFTLYEEEISADSKLQVQSLPSMIGCVQSLKNLEDEAYAGLAQKLASYSGRLLKKPDQCKIAFLCSHLFWKAGREDLHKKVLDCLQKSLKIVDGCSAAQQTPLFVEILNKYLYFFQKRNEHVTVKYVNVLMQLINENISKQEDEPIEPGVAPSATFYQNTIAHIKANQDGTEDAERWQEINTSC